MRRLLAVFIVALLGGFIGAKLPTVHAQSATAVEFEYVVAKTSCAPTTSATVFCFAADTGLWISLNGAATFTQIGAAATPGVTSWNGQTGAVTYTPPVAPVVSVNGKTGAVVITAATQLN